MHRISAQTGTGTITGQILDGGSSEPLPGATVGVKDTPLETVTDRDGRYRIAGVPAGAQVLVVRFLGRRDQQVEVTVGAGATLEKAIVFDQPYAYNETVSVTSELILDAQARALNQQKNAPNITNVVSADQIGSFPDPNAAETTQRIPGIIDHQGPGRGTLRQRPRHRAAAELDDDRRRAHSRARSAAPPGRARRRPVGAAAGDRGLEGADARTWTPTRSAAASTS